MNERESSIDETKVFTLARKAFALMWRWRWVHPLDDVAVRLTRLHCLGPCTGAILGFYFSSDELASCPVLGSRSLILPQADGRTVTISFLDLVEQQPMPSPDWKLSVDVAGGKSYKMSVAHKSEWAQFYFLLSSIHADAVVHSGQDRTRCNPDGQS